MSGACPPAAPPTSCRRSTAGGVPPLQPPPDPPRGRAWPGSGGSRTPGCCWSAPAASARRWRSTWPPPASAPLGIVEADRVDATNLQRQVLHGTARRGAAEGGVGPRPAAGPQPLRPGRARTTPGSTPDNALELVRAYDLVVDGTDNFATRYLVNDACVLAGRPNVYGSVFRFEGQASVFCRPGRPLLPLPLPGAAAARPGPLLRRGRRARRAARAGRAHPGHRGDQAAARRRRRRWWGGCCWWTRSAMRFRTVKVRRGPALPGLRHPRAAHPGRRPDASAPGRRPRRPAEVAEPSPPPSCWRG